MASSSLAKNHPLLVRVQTIDTKSLDFKIGGSYRPKNVTCIEASNLYVFLGVMSGTVYVFTREKETFQFMIPCKGGKVCSISCAENERELAVGSLRGQVSVYQLMDPSGVQEASHGSGSTTFFKHLHTLEHHKGNEITELHWSPNGRYLFVGDSQGVVSQANVGSWEDFPRPLTPSQVILKLKNRVIQICFAFPYLAVSTVGEVVLCDIENEGFVRVRFDNKTDIRATGLALVLSDVNSDTKASETRLYVSEAGSGYLHCFNLQGQLLKSTLLTMDSFLTRHPVATFDPVTESTPTQVADIPPSATLGKLYLSDSNLLLSISNHHVHVIDPVEIKLILWSDDFQKIKGVKLLSNYMFLWSGTKVQVISLTQVLPYSEQLFSSGATVAFERWIHHMLTSFGLDEGHEREEEEEGIKALSLFRKLMRGDDKWDDSTEFQKSVSKIVPFPMPDPAEEEPVHPLMHIMEPLREMVEWLNGADALLRKYMESDAPQEDYLKAKRNQFALCFRTWRSMQKMYNRLDLTGLCYLDEPGLFEVMTSAENFHSSVEALNLYSEMSKLDDDFMKLLEVRFLSFLELVALGTSKFDLWTPTILSEDHDELQFFTAFVGQDPVVDWLVSFRESPYPIQWDAFMADMLLLALPLLSPETRLQIVRGIQDGYPEFCSWLLTTTFYNIDSRSPYELQLRSIFSSDGLGYSFPQQIAKSVYNDFVHDDNHFFAASIHHMVSILYFFAPDNQKSDEDDATEKKSQVLDFLIDSIPVKHWPKHLLQAQLLKLFTQNPVLVEYFRVACLNLIDDELNSCGCGLVMQKSGPGLPMFNITPLALCTLQEVIIETLLNMGKDAPIRVVEESGFGYHFDLLSVCTDQSFSLFPKDKAFEFAIKTDRLEVIVRKDPRLQLPGVNRSLLFQIILRLSACELLEAIEGPLEDIGIVELLEQRENLLASGECCLCGQLVKIPPAFSSISMDCIGTWLLNRTSSVEEFKNYIENTPPLNVVGCFSDTFYHMVADRAEKEVAPHDDFGRNSLELSFPVPCSLFHDKNGLPRRWSTDSFFGRFVGIG